MFDLSRPCGVLEQTQQGMDGVMRWGYGTPRDPFKVKDQVA